MSDDYNVSDTNNRHPLVLPLCLKIKNFKTDDVISQGLPPTCSIHGIVGTLAPETIHALRQFSSLSHYTETIALDVPTGCGNTQRVELATTLIEPRGEGGALWVGHSRLFPGQEGHLSIVESPANSKLFWVSGRIQFDDGQCWLIHPRKGNEIHLVQASLPPKTCFAPVPVRLQHQNYTAYASSSEPTGFSGEGDLQDTAVIQIVAACPDSTLQKLNMDARAVRAKVGDWQNVVNQIMRNSGIPARIEIVDKLHSLPEPENNMVRELLRETLANSGDPSRNKKGPGSLWTEVKALRDQTRADLVLLLAADLTGDVLGEAGAIPLPPRADLADDLALCTLCFCPEASGYDVGHVFAHELGHLLGGLHDVETDMMDSHHYDFPPMFDYVCGYVPTDRSFATTMAYPSEGKPWIMYYSAADKSWVNPKTGLRQAVGVPFGLPNAADAASFFKYSTRTVAGYRGGAKTRLYDLKLNVSPPLGGTLKPGSWGPYPEAARVTVQAVSRPGYVFDHWTLNGKEAGSAQSLSVVVQAAQTVTAHFREGSKRFHLKTAIEADRDVKATLSIYSADNDPQSNQRQPGPDYHPGTEVYIDCNVVTPDSEEDKFLGWRVNGSSHLIQGYQSIHPDKRHLNRLIVRMDQDVMAEAVFAKG